MHCKKETLEERVQKAIVQLLSRDKTTQTSGSVFAERIEKVKKTKFELELIKIVGCFRDGHGNFDSILVSFKQNFL